MISLNLQPRESRDAKHDGLTLDVVNVWLTLQGEGPFAGQPAVFMRLAGCNLECPLCDTDYTNLRRDATLDELVLATRNLSITGLELIVLTGGEPMRQNIAPFVDLMISAGRRVQIETNGTYYVEDLPYEHPKLSIVCSPKAPALHPRIAEHITAFKYVVRSGYVSPDDGLPETVMGMNSSVARPFHLSYRRKDHNVFVQPLDEQDPVKNAANMQAAIHSCLHFGYTLSVQIHKIAGLE